MYPTDELLRTVMDEREREIQERIRLRQLTGQRHPMIRWRRSQAALGRQPEKR
jgi:hypothetical protein